MNRRGFFRGLAVAALGAAAHVYAPKALQAPALADGGQCFDVDDGTHAAPMMWGPPPRRGLPFADGDRCVDLDFDYCGDMTMRISGTERGGTMNSGLIERLLDDEDWVVELVDVRVDDSPWVNRRGELMRPEVARPCRGGVLVAGRRG